MNFTRLALLQMIHPHAEPRTPRKGVKDARQKDTHSRVCRCW